MSCLLILFLKNFLYLFLAALGLRCCTWAFSSCGERGLLFVAVRGLLIAVASLVAEHGLQAHGLQSSGSVVVVHGPSCSASTWDLPEPRLEPVLPALAGGFLITAPPGKPLLTHSLSHAQGTTTPETHSSDFSGSLVEEPPELTSSKQENNLNSKTTCAFW